MACFQNLIITPTWISLVFVVVFFGHQYYSKSFTFRVFTLYRECRLSCLLYFLVMCVITLQSLYIRGNVLTLSVMRLLQHPVYTSHFLPTQIRVPATEIRSAWIHFLQRTRISLAVTVGCCSYFTRFQRDGIVVEKVEGRIYQCHASKSKLYVSYDRVSNAIIDELKISRQ